MNTLAQLRDQIDAIDARLLALFNERAKVVLEVGEIKRQEGSPVFRPERERQIVANLQASNAGPLLNESIAPIWREIMSAARKLEGAQRVAYLGPAGTFSEQAAHKHFGSGLEGVPCISIDEVFRASASGAAQFGVVPIENSTEGVVARTLDLLRDSPLTVVGEVSLWVRHNLLALQTDLSAIKAVHAHPQALAQCQAWLSAHLPHAERVASASNAMGAQLASVAGPHSGVAALASERAAAEFGLHIVAPGIQDDAHNRTRFGVVCLPGTVPPATATGKDCISLVISVPNRPGAVHDLLVPLKTHGVSMTRFESRPARSGQWEYYFYIEVVGHRSQTHVALALAELESLCAYFKVLGEYAIA